MTAPPTTHLRARPRRLAAIAVTATLAAGAIGPALVASAVAPAPARGATPAAKPAPPASPSPGGRAVPSAAPGPDFSSYQALLDDYLVVTSAPGASIDTRFDYERLYDARDRNPRFDRIRADLLAVSPDSMAPGVRRAWAVNTYNFLVLETATRNLLIPMRGRTRYTDPREIRVQGAQFFKAPIVTIDSIVLSLDEFEDRFARLGWKPASGPPPAGFDPRVHFALVCGARGCPPLMPRAYRADSLEQQLEAATRNAFALKRHLRFDGTRLEVSELFRWYPHDFGGRAGMLAFIRRYAPARVRDELDARQIKTTHGFIPWDWTLNQFPRSQVQ